MSLYDPVPKYLVGTPQLTSTVTFAAFFALAALVVSTPFSQNIWFALGANMPFAMSAGFFLVALSIVVASKMLMHRYYTLLNMTVLRYLVWNLAEIVLVALLYTFTTVEGIDYGIIELSTPTSFAKLFAGSFVYTVACLGVPYIIAGGYYALRDKNNTIKLLNMGSVVTDLEPAPEVEKKITLFDDSGTLKLVVSSYNLYYIESDDNYIKVWYQDSKGELKQYMLRCRLKTVEDSFAGSDLMRCHRKYIVNMAKVNIISREKDGYYIDLGRDAIEPVPVSKTYEESILSRFNSR